MKRLYVPVCAVLLLCLAGCSKDDELSVSIPDSFIFSAADEWAVITEPYTPFYEEPAETAQVSAHARAGDIFLVDGKSIEKHTIWYRFEKGWLPADVVTVYSNRLKADRAAAELK